MAKALEMGTCVSASMGDYMNLKIYTFSTLAGRSENGRQGVRWTVWQVNQVHAVKSVFHACFLLIR